MNYWMICLPREDMDHCIKIGAFGLKRKIVIGEVKEGDKVACVVTREKPEWKVVALGETKSDYYLDDKPIFMKEGLFCDRFNFSAKRLKPEMGFKQLITKLSFITLPENYSVFFRNGIVKLKEQDWELISKLAEKA